MANGPACAAPSVLRNDAIDERWRSLFYVRAVLHDCLEGGITMFSKREGLQDLEFAVAGVRAGFWLLLAALLLLLLAAPPSALAQGSSGRCFLLSSRASFRMPSSGFLSGTIPVFLNTDCTPPSDGTYSAGEYGTVEAYDRDEAIRKCDKYNGYSNKVAPVRRLWNCRPIIDDDDESSDVNENSSKKGRSKAAARRIVKPAGPPTGEIIQRFGIKVTAELGLNSGIQFQRRDTAAVGLQLGHRHGCTGHCGCLGRHRRRL